MRLGLLTLFIELIESMTLGSALVPTRSMCTGKANFLAKRSGEFASRTAFEPPKRLVRVGMKYGAIGTTTLNRSLWESATLAAQNPPVE